MSSSRCKLAISRANLLWAINPSESVLSRLLLFVKVANNIIEEWHRSHFLLEMNGGCWPWWRRLPLSSIICRNIFLSCLCWERFAVCLHLNSEFWLFFARKSPGQNSRKSGVIWGDCSNREESIGFERWMICAHPTKRRKSWTVCPGESTKSHVGVQ